MGVHEARHHDHAGGIDDFGTRGADRFADLLDLRAIDKNIALGEVAGLAVHRDDGAALDEGLGHINLHPVSKSSRGADPGCSV